MTKTLSRVQSFDILKIVCAFLIVCIHILFKNSGGVLLALERTAVPCFFMITGYFYQITCDKHREKKQIIKILKLTLITNVLAFLFHALIAIVEHSLTPFFHRYFNLSVIVNFVVFNESPFFYHLWYLTTILYVLLLINLWEQRLHMNRNKLYFLIPILLLCNLVFGKYSILVFGKVFPFIYTRNFLFVGLPYFLIGDLIHLKFRPKRQQSNKSIILCVLTIVLFIFVSIKEKQLLNTNGYSSPGQREHYFSTTFISIAMIMLSLNLNREKYTKVEEFLSELGRKYSMLIYIIHPVFIIILNIIVRNLDIKPISEFYAFTAPIIIFIISMCAAIIIEKILTKRKESFI